MPSLDMHKRILPFLVQAESEELLQQTEEAGLASLKFDHINNLYPVIAAAKDGFLLRVRQLHAVAGTLEAALSLKLQLSRDDTGNGEPPDKHTFDMRHVTSSYTYRCYHNKICPACHTCLRFVLLCLSLLAKNFVGICSGFILSAPHSQRTIFDQISELSLSSVAFLLNQFVKELLGRLWELK